MNLNKISIAGLALATTIQVNAAPANATMNNITPAEKAKIEEVVHQYLLRKPEVLVEALQILQKKQYQEAEQTVKKTKQIAATFATPLFHQANDPVAGNPNGTVTVAEFFDYQCPHCVDMAPVMEAIVKANPNLRVVYKEFPIRGEVSKFAARAALAANLQGKYVVFSHALLAAAKDNLTQDLVMRVAKDQGLDVEKLKIDMDSDAIKNQLNANIKLGQDLKLLGTPAIFIGNTNAKASGSIDYVPGQMSKDELQAAINKTAKS